MSLMVSSYNAIMTSSNLAASPSISPGTTLTSHASVAHSKGAYVELITSSPYDAYGVTILLRLSTQSAAVRNTLVDFSTGASGSEIDFISNLCAGGALDISSGCVELFCPMFIPTGSRVAGRIQSNALGTTIKANTFLHGRPSGPAHTFHGAQVYGTDTATSAGTNITAGDSGVESSWVSIGSTTDRVLKAITPRLQGNSAITVYNSLGYHFEVGYDSTAIGEIYCNTTTGEAILNPFPGHPIYHHIPKGTQLQMRGECSGTAQQLQACILGFY